MAVTWCKAKYRAGKAYKHQKSTHSRSGKNVTKRTDKNTPKPVPMILVVDGGSGRSRLWRQDDWNSQNA